MESWRFCHINLILRCIKMSLMLQSKNLRVFFGYVLWRNVTCEHCCLTVTAPESSFISGSLHPQLFIFRAIKAEGVDFTQCVTHGSFLYLWQETTYNMFHFVTLYVFPLLVMIFCYTRIFTKINGQIRKNKGVWVTCITEQNLQCSSAVWSNNTKTSHFQRVVTLTTGMAVEGCRSLFLLNIRGWLHSTRWF